MTADATQIRKKYLKLAKILHPDLPGRSADETEFAKNFLAKMVNPAYQLLSNDRERGEYFATLRLFAQTLKQKQFQFEPQSDVAKKLQKFPHATNYNKFFNEITELQYQSLDKLLDYTNDLSELNLIYLIMQDDIIPMSIVKPKDSDDTTIGSAAKPASPALRNIQFAQLMIDKKQWVEAIKELRAGEKLDPNNAKIYALIGLVQMNQGIAVMAKNSFQKALKLDPKEPTALKYVNQVSSPAQQASKSAPKKEEKKGGFFGWGK